jgi:hypothetical protein
MTTFRSHERARRGGSITYRLHALSPACQRLVREMQRIGHGRIENLLIRNGEPLFSPPPLVQLDFVFCRGDDACCPGLWSSDFELKGEIIDLFAKLGHLRNVVVKKLEIKGGLPFKMTVDGSQAE